MPNSYHNPLVQQSKRKIVLLGRARLSLSGKLLFPFWTGQAHNEAMSSSYPRLEAMAVLRKDVSIHRAGAPAVKRPPNGLADIMRLGDQTAVGNRSLSDRRELVET